MSEILQPVNDEQKPSEADKTLQAYEELKTLNKDLSLLEEEKLNLANIESELWLKINEEMENRKRRKEALEKEVEQLRVRCEKLTEILNMLIQESQGYQ